VHSERSNGTDSNFDTYRSRKLGEDERIFKGEGMEKELPTVYSISSEDIGH
jgi:hypothetical protein